MIFNDYISGMGGSLAAKKLREKKTPGHAGWGMGAGHITEIIKNETMIDSYCSY